MSDFIAMNRVYSLLLRAWESEEEVEAGDSPGLEIGSKALRSRLFPNVPESDSETEAEEGDSESILKLIAALEALDSDSDLDVASQSEQTHFRSGDAVLFLNSTDDRLKRDEETRQLLYIAVFLIAFQRRLFSGTSFKGVYMPSLGIRINEVLPEDRTSFRFLCFLKGVHEALKRNYVKGLWLRISDDKGLKEEYAFNFTWKEPRVSSEISFRSAASTLIKTLEQQLDGFLELPENYTLSIGVVLNESAPADYEPSWFRGWKLEGGEEFLDFTDGIESGTGGEEFLDFTDGIEGGTVIMIENRYCLRIILQVMSSLDRMSTDTESSSSSMDAEGKEGKEGRWHVTRLGVSATN